LALRRLLPLVSLRSSRRWWRWRGLRTAGWRRRWLFLRTRLRRWRRSRLALRRCRRRRGRRLLPLSGRGRSGRRRLGAGRFGGGRRGRLLTVWWCHLRGRLGCLVSLRGRWRRSRFALRCRWGLLAVFGRGCLLFLRGCYLRGRLGSLRVLG